MNDERPTMNEKRETTSENDEYDNAKFLSSKLERNPRTHPGAG